MNLRNVTLTAIASAIAIFAQPNATLDGPFQVRYAANLDLVGAPESWVNITNTGARGARLASLPAGASAAGVTGAICVNVYVFSPDEQMVSCCACPVTPNGIANLGVRRDLINNPLTRITPTSVAIKLLATVPVNGSCNAALPGTQTLSSGLLAWGTTVRASNGGFETTETPFLPATLSGAPGGTTAYEGIGEYTRLQQLCTFIQANGSGNGICESCRLGAFGGAKK